MAAHSEDVVAKYQRKTTSSQQKYYKYQQQYYKYQQQYYKYQQQYYKQQQQSFKNQLYLTSINKKTKSINYNKTLNKLIHHIFPFFRLHNCL